jgi:hypothetical protein
VCIHTRIAYCILYVDAVVNTVTTYICLYTSTYVDTHQLRCHITEAGSRHTLFVYIRSSRVARYPNIPNEKVDYSNMEAEKYDKFTKNSSCQCVLLVVFVGVDLCI